MLFRWFPQGRQRPPDRPCPPPRVEALEERLAPDAALSSQQVVAQLYHDLLQRVPDPSGLAHWSAALDVGLTRTEVASQIESSTEFHTHSVQDLYQQFLHREADPSGLAFHVAALDAGATTARVVASLASSPEYAGRGGGGDLAFVSALVSDALGRSVADADLADYGGALARGASRVRVIDRVFASAEGQRRQVASWYEQFLGRPADPSGLAAWADALSRGASADAVIAALVGSAESVGRTRGGLVAPSSGGGVGPAAASIVTPPLLFQGINPIRVVDTRFASTASVYGSPVFANGETRSYSLVPGIGTNTLPAGVKALVMTVTMVGATGSVDYITIWPMGGAFPPTASMVTDHAGALATSEVISAVGGGSISVFAFLSTNVVIDITGFFIDDLDTGTQVAVTGNVGGGLFSSSNATTIPLGSGLLGQISSTASGIHSAGLRGINSNTGSNGYGVWGTQNGVGVGVRGDAAGAGTGVYGVVTVGAGTGVIGQATATGGTGVAGYGDTIGVFASGATGVSAIATTGTGTGVSGTGGAIGVSGTAFGVGTGVSGSGGVTGTGVSGSGGVTGVNGVAGNTTGLTYGVQGTAASSTANSAGVHGVSSSTATQVYGVLGEISSTTAGSTSAGVRGVNSSTGVNGYGVYGSQAGTGIGVRGEVTGAGTGVAGVAGAGGIGLSGSGGATGVSGSGFATGVIGSGSFTGVSGSGMTGVSGSGLTGVYGSGGATGIGVSGEVSGSGVGVKGIAPVAGTAVLAMGSLTVTGAKFFVDPHPTDPTKQIAYVALEGPEVGTYFRGRGHFTNGMATIAIPEIFRLETETEGLGIQVTPIGRLANVAVQGLDLNRAVVLGSEDVDFYFTLNGVRKGYANYNPIQDNTVFVPRGQDTSLWGALNAEQQARLVATGVYNADGTVNRVPATTAG